MNPRPPVPAEQQLGLLVWAALTALQLSWHVWLFRSPYLPLLVATISVTPLLLPLLAIRNPRRALLWVGILSLFYFCHGVAESWSSSSERWLALGEVALTVLLIGTLGAGVRRKHA